MTNRVTNKTSLVYASIITDKLAKDITLTQMTNEVKDYLVTTYGSLDSWLYTNIEATINILKNILNLDGGEGVSDIIN